MTACHVCGCQAVETLDQRGARFRLVSSDVRPVEGTAEFSVCRQCCTVQKVVTPAWRAMIERIYAHYDINHQSRGAEPMIFDSARGSGPRSQILLHNFLDLVPLAETGRLLDIGCSNGNLLKSFHALRPRWTLSGSELSDTWREKVMALPGVERFYSGTDPDYAGLFDLISLSHVLEHVPDPIGFLQEICRRLTPGGRILVAVPNLAQNPIDLLIADHCTHFDSQSLHYVARQSGLVPELLSEGLLPKELIAVLSVDGRPDAALVDEACPVEVMKERCQRQFALIDEVRDAARTAAMDDKPFGIMGSSIAACWAMLELEGRVGFFVDEDPNRIGHSLGGLPILQPTQVPAGAVVFIPMSVAVARRIVGRWRHLPIDFRFVATNQPG